MDKLREEFEVLYMKHNPESSVAFNHPVGRYKYAYTQAQYEFFLDAWQASRASIVVELPTKHDPADMFVSGAYDAEEIAFALRSIGLSIKGE
ncbi:TPA: hypothetical protein PFA69_004624 [Serratia marcescens]|nr:hypothetical protein [Serratia marcescens]